jgi:hypothetical protein
MRGAGQSRGGDLVRATDHTDDHAAVERAQQLTERESDTATGRVHQYTSTRFNARTVTNGIERREKDGRKAGELHRRPGRNARKELTPRHHDIFRIGVKTSHSKHFRTDLRDRALASGVVL